MATGTHPISIFFSNKSETRAGSKRWIGIARATKAEGRHMGTLDFPQLEFKVLGSEVVLARGQWRLKMPDGKESTGMTSVTFQKRPEGWRIVLIIRRRSGHVGVSTVLCVVVMSVNSYAQTRDTPALLRTIDHLVTRPLTWPPAVRHIEAVLGIQATPAGNIQAKARATRSSLSVRPRTSRSSVPIPINQSRSSRGNSKSTI
jgi:hypothetical protein